MMPVDDGSTLFQKLIALLPAGLLVMLAVSNMLFCAMTIFPQWSAYEQAGQLLNDGQSALTATAVQLSDDNDPAIVEIQLTRAHEGVREAAGVFLSQAQADAIVSKLYNYAAASGVEVIMMQNQPVAMSETTLPYSLQVLQLQLKGGVPPLVNFVARLQETKQPGFVLRDLNITGTNIDGILTTTLELYISAEAPAEPALSSQPTITAVASLTPVPATVDANLLATQGVETATAFASTGTPSASITPSETVTSTLSLSQPVAASSPQSTQTPWVVVQTAAAAVTQPAQIIVVTQIQIQVQPVIVPQIITATLSPTPTFTVTPTSTLTFTPTLTPTLTATPTLTPTLTQTPTLTPTETPTETPTLTPTETSTP